MLDTTPKLKKQRFSAAEARAAVIKAAWELLDENGIGSGLAAVRLNDAIVKSGVPRPSAYRVFSQSELNPQEEFRAALLLDLLDDTGYWEGSIPVVKAFEEVMLSEADKFESDDPVERAYVLRQLIRLVGQVGWDTHPDPKAAAFLGAVMSIVLNDEPPSPVVEGVRQVQQTTALAYASLYEGLMTLLGGRFRDGFTPVDLASLISMAFDQVWDGIARYGRDVAIQRATGFEGENQAWTPLGITIEGLILATCEPDPDAEATVDLASWLVSRTPPA